ncbi:MAG: helix-turn-helix domain-containing protein [Actinobacteria bacterium]|nr:helix-turn-helix domain-containing protein [Actinomycetota bacterium]
MHPNTLRYRLQKIQDLTGRHPLVPRERFTFSAAVLLHELRDAL